MTVEPARTNGKCRCEQDLDPCGHHLQVCQHRASFLWSHQIWQGSFTNEAASIPGVNVVTTTAHGLPHETTTQGKQPDALITVPQPPGLYGPLLYPTSIMGTGKHAPRGLFPVCEGCWHKFIRLHASADRRRRPLSCPSPRVPCSGWSLGILPG